MTCHMPHSTTCQAPVVLQELLVTMAMDALSREHTARPALYRQAESAEQPSRIASPRRNHQAAAAQDEQAELRARELEAQLWVAEQKVSDSDARLASYCLNPNFSRCCSL